MYQQIFSLETPSLIIEYPKLVNNIKWIQQKANENGVRLRPHAKTHKCFEIAALQREHGAIGITVAKLSEAIKFLEKGINDVLIAYPIVDQSKMDRFLQTVKSLENEEKTISVALDSDFSLSVVANSSEKYQKKVNVYVEIDVGLGRVGIKESEMDRIFEIVKQITKHPYLEFKGILSHAGQAYACKSESQIKDVALLEIQILMRIKSAIEEKIQVKVQEVSVGSTPTVIASSIFTGITEIRPGNYVFMDKSQLSKNYSNVSFNSISLFVIATVVSVNTEYSIIDAGSKMMSSDLAPHSADGISGYGTVFTLEDYELKKDPRILTKLSEEHGWIKNETSQSPLKVGMKVCIIPNHSCPTANLSDSYVVIGKEENPITWNIIARGCVK